MGIYIETSPSSAFRNSRTRLAKGGQSKRKGHRGARSSVDSIPNVDPEQFRREADLGWNCSTRLKIEFVLVAAAAASATRGLFRSRVTIGRTLARGRMRRRMLAVDRFRDDLGGRRNHYRGRANHDRCGRWGGVSAFSASFRTLFDAVGLSASNCYASEKYRDAKR